MLLEAFSRLRGRNAELWMLGEGPDENALRERAAALGLGEQVRWLGFQDNPYPFFRAADCFALTSNHEGLPNAIIEAMACGTPAVSTRCKFGPEELIEDGVSGRLTPVGNAEVFGRVLHRLCGAPDEASRLGAAARSRTLVDFDTQDVCRTYEDLFEAVL